MEEFFYLETYETVLRLSTLHYFSYIAKRHSKANKKYIKNYDPTKPSKYISYLDMNNLYSWGMSGYGAFKWLKNVASFDVNSIRKKVQ